MSENSWSSTWWTNRLNESYKQDPEEVAWSDNWDTIAPTESILDSMVAVLEEAGYKVGKPLRFEDIKPVTKLDGTGVLCYIPDLASLNYCCPFYYSEGNQQHREFLARRVLYATPEEATVVAKHIIKYLGGT